MREDYVSQVLEESSLPAAPFELFNRWIQEACSPEAQLHEPNAMCLATVGADGHPSARMVLLKGLDERGIVWYTNYQSRKARELAGTPHAAATFWWGPLSRSVRLEGVVERVSAEESNTYFNSRPVGSRVGAWVSDQSQPIGSREEFDEKAERVQARFKTAGEREEDVQVPRPPHWGGFRLKPTRVEFWCGRASRLHDRIVYSLGQPEGGPGWAGASLSGGGEGDSAGPGSDAGSGWSVTRLQP